MQQQIGFFQNALCKQMIFMQIWTPILRKYAKIWPKNWRPKIPKNSVLTNKWSFERNLISSLCFLWTFIISPNTTFATVYNGPTDISWRILSDLVIDGPAKLRLVKAKSMQLNGPLEFHSISIEGNADISGDMNGEKGKFGSLNVEGIVNVDHVLMNDFHAVGFVTASYMEVRKNASIDGPLNAYHSEFNTLKVKADEIILSEVLANNIIIESTPNQQTLILKDSTTINGDITFESGKGILQVEGFKVRIKGSVKGAITRL